MKKKIVVNLAVDVEVELDERLTKGYPTMEAIMAALGDLNGPGVVGFLVTGTGTEAE